MTEFDGYILIEYHIFKAKVLKENKKTYTVSLPTENETRRVPKDKYVSKATPFCLVWERWKGVNGRGGYRLETKLYQDVLALGGSREMVYENEEVTNDFQ